MHCYSLLFLFISLYIYLFLSLAIALPQSIVMWRKETEAQERSAPVERKPSLPGTLASNDGSAYAVIDQIEPLPSAHEPRVVSLYKNASFAPGPGEHAPVEIPEPVHKAEIGNVPHYWWKMAAVVAVTLAAAACELVRGGHASHGGMNVCIVPRIFSFLL